ncbi:hypothetical protein IFM89_029669, partial [Coptis chinensis]
MISLVPGLNCYPILLEGALKIDYNSFYCFDCVIWVIDFSGLPPRYRDSVRAITPGLPLFLYNYSNHQLHGVS